MGWEECWCSCLWTVSWATAHSLGNPGGEQPSGSTGSSSSELILGVFPPCWHQSQAGFPPQQFETSHLHLEEGRRGLALSRPFSREPGVSFLEFPEPSPCFSLVPTESHVHSSLNPCGRETPHAHWVMGTYHRDKGERGNGTHGPADRQTPTPNCQLERRGSALTKEG